MNLAFFIQCFTRKKKKSSSNGGGEEEEKSSSADCHWLTCICSTYDIDEEMKKAKGTKGNGNKDDQVHDSKEDKPQEKKNDEKKPTKNELLCQSVVFEVQPPWTCPECDQELYKTLTETEGITRTKVDVESGRIVVKGAVDTVALAEKIRKILKKDVRIIRFSYQRQEETVEHVDDYGTNQNREETVQPTFDYGVNPDPVRSAFWEPWTNLFERPPIPTAPPLH